MAGFWSRCRVAPAPNAVGTVALSSATIAEYFMVDPLVDQCSARLGLVLGNLTV